MLLDTHYISEPIPDTVSLVALVLLGDLTPHASQVSPTGLPSFWQALGLQLQARIFLLWYHFLPLKRAGVHSGIHQLQGNRHRLTCLMLLLVALWDSQMTIFLLRHSIPTPPHPTMEDECGPRQLRYQRPFTVEYDIFRNRHLAQTTGSPGSCPYFH